MAKPSGGALPAARSVPRTRTALALESLALRHQILVLKRSGTRRPCFRVIDRLFWILLSRWWPRWREVDGKKTVLDFKTSGSTYAEHEVRLSDQLTAYQLAEPQAEQMALCVLVKTKEPKIEWHVSERNPDDLIDYLAKAGHVAREIGQGRFFKRPGMWCAWCDFLPVCLRDEKKIAETLVRMH